MQNRPRRIYWDSCVFIALISNLMTSQATDRRWHCQRFFDDAINGRITIVTSVITIAEVVRAEVEPGTPVNPVPPDIRKKIEDLFNEPYLQLVHVDPARTAAARDITWQFPQIKYPDSVHVACARYAQVDAMHTYDGDGKQTGLLSFNGRVGNPSLQIVVPQWTGNIPLPLT